MLGLTCLLQGDFPQAQAHLEEALRSYDPERDRDAKFRFGQDAGAAAFTYLAITNWILGQVGFAGARMEEGLARGLESNHPVTQANINYFTAIFEIVRGDVDGARRASQTAVEVSREHGLPQFALWGALSNAWARARLKDRDTGLAELREALEAGIARGDKLNVPLYQGLLAELEAEGQDVEANGYFRIGTTRKSPHVGLTSATRHITDIHSWLRGVVRKFLSNKHPPR
jgi:hypothetical protein